MPDETRRMSGVQKIKAEAIRLIEHQDHLGVRASLGLIVDLAVELGTLRADVENGATFVTTDPNLRMVQPALVEPPKDKPGNWRFCPDCGAAWSTSQGRSLVECRCDGPGVPISEKIATRIIEAGLRRLAGLPESSLHTDPILRELDAAAATGLDRSPGDDLARRAAEVIRGQAIWIKKLQQPLPANSPQGADAHEIACEIVRRVGPPKSLLSENDPDGKWRATIARVLPEYGVPSGVSNIPGDFVGSVARLLAIMDAKEDPYEDDSYSPLRKSVDSTIAGLISHEPVVSKADAENSGPSRGALKGTIMYLKKSRDELLAAVNQSRAIEADLRRERDEINQDRGMYVNAWARELGPYRRNKTHLIDGLVLGTQDMQAEAEKHKAERAVRRGAVEAAIQNWTAGLPSFPREAVARMTDELLALLARPVPGIDSVAEVLYRSEDPSHRSNFLATVDSTRKAWRTIALAAYEVFGIPVPTMGDKVQEVEIGPGELEIRKAKEREVIAEKLSGPKPGEPSFMLPNLLVQIFWTQDREHREVYFADKPENSDTYYAEAFKAQYPTVGWFTIRRGIKPATGGKGGL